MKQLSTGLSPLLLALVLASGAGCDKGSSTENTASAGTATSASSAAPSTKGLASVDPKIADLAKKAAACKSYETGFDGACPEYKAWSDAKDDFVDGKNDAALVSMTEDGDPKIRNLGASKLNQWGKTFTTDKALAARLITVVEAEKATFPSYELGSAVGRIKARDTGLMDRMNTIAKKHEVPTLRAAFFSTYLWSNSDNDGVFNVVRDEVKDPDKKAAMAALQSFWTGGSNHVNDTCQLYADNVNNPNDDLSAEASNALSWYRKCSAKYDILLTSVEARVKADKVPSSSFATALKHICEPDSQGSDAQKKHAADLGRKMAQSKVTQGFVRGYALEAVQQCDAKGGAGFLKKMEKDADATVKAKAAELLAKK